MSNVVRDFGRRIAVACALSVLWSSSGHAQSASFIRDCRHWIDKKGYSTE